MVHPIARHRKIYRLPMMYGMLTMNFICIAVGMRYGFLEASKK
jgi:hypothetical protein